MLKATCKLLLVIALFVYLLPLHNAALPTAHGRAICTVGGASPTHASLEAALADAACDPIQLAAGTYTTAGAQLQINRSVSIVGAGSSSVRIVPSANTGSSGNSRAWIHIRNGATVNWSNVTFDGSGRLVNIGLMYGDSTIPPTFSASGTLQNVVIQNTTWPPYLGRAVAIYGGGTLNVSSLTVSNTGRIGIYAYGAGTVLSVNGYTFNGKGPGDCLDYGIEVEGGAHATVTNCTISNALGVASTDGSGSAGVLATTYFAAGTQVVMTNCTFINNNAGINVGYNASDTTTLTVHNSTFQDNEYGIVSTAPAVNAENNTWTCNIANCTFVDGNVDYTPVYTPPAASGDPAPSGPSAADHARAQAPLCADLDGSTDTVVRADVPGGTVPSGGVFCRVIARNSTFVHSPAEIGSMDVINAGVIQAVDVFGMAGGQSVPNWNSSIKLCLQGSGRLLFLDALTSPRALTALPTTSEGGYTCATVYHAGTIALVP